MKKKNKKTHIQPKIVGYVNDKKSTSVSLKKRIAAYVLLAFMVLWSIGSLISVILAFDKLRNDSAMITADAAPPVSSDASNVYAFEFNLVALSVSSFNAYSEDVQGQINQSMMNYEVHLYIDPLEGYSLKFYDYDVANPLYAQNYVDGPIVQSYSFGSAPTYLAIDNFGLENTFVIKSDSGSYLPSITDTPVQVSYVPSTRTFDSLPYVGYNIFLFTLSESGSVRRFDFFFGVWGTSFFCPYQGTSSTGFYSIPMAPLTYNGYIYYGLNADTVDSLRDQIRELQTENNQLLNQVNNAFNNGVSDGYNAGYKEGYETGKIAGAAGANDYSFFSLISAVVDVPVQAFSSLFNFELLGFNLLNFFLGVITVALVIKLLKWFL